MSNEVQTFLDVWDNEAKKTVAMLQALPEGQYDFRPDRGGRSLGELAWHLAEIDRKSTRLNSSHSGESRMPSSA